MKEDTIGERIEKEVRKQEWNITEFADAICCKRNNVYDIFKRNNIDIQLLARISKVLKHNYFQDLAENPELADMNLEESETERENRKAVAQFFDVMPSILTKLGMNNTITFDKSEETKENDIPTPDMILPDYLVCFTIGNRWINKANISQQSSSFQVITKKMENGTLVDIVDNKLFGSTMIDIKLDYKTAKEWESVMRFVKEECLKYAKLPRRFFYQ
jgi:hypothetical protein